MDFGLSPDQIELRDAVRRMARRDLASGYLTAQVQKIVIARERFGRDFVPYGRRVAIRR
jgi:hypothetical protein